MLIFKPWVLVLLFLFPMQNPDTGKRGVFVNTYKNFATAQECIEYGNSIPGNLRYLVGKKCTITGHDV